MGFYMHDDMNFVVTERKECAAPEVLLNGDMPFDAGAIAGAYEVC